MRTITAAVIGTGPEPEDVGPDGFAMGYQHAEALEQVDGCDLIACADIVPENAQAFADEFGIEDDRVFEDHGEMLETVDPDVVTVAVPPAVHADVVIDCARHGVGAIHCEKPMAKTWGDSRLMVQECDRHDVQLTFNHQRRFKPSWEKAAELVEEGEVGSVRRVETHALNLYDWGTHCLDALGFYTGDEPADWVLAGLDYSEENIWFGAHNENHAVARWAYESGVQGVAYTGDAAEIMECRHRIVGDEGEIRVEVEDGPSVDLRRFDGDGASYDLGRGAAIADALTDVVDAYREGRESRLDAHNALNATEIIFGAWESVRRRGRVAFPLEIDDNPLEDMVEQGLLTPEPREGED